MLPEIDDPATRAAATTTGLGLLIALGWRVLLYLRGGQRSDNAGQTQQQAYRDIIADQEAHIARLDARIAAMDKRVTDLSIRVNEEITQRYIAETELRNCRSENGGLRARISELEGL